ncbi:putative ubiquitin carboxyl-terminal hydrolase MINDY-4 [Stigmatopora nigra]
MAICVEEVSASLVREYLSRKGLKRTIACMDEERPRTQSSINNRSNLRQVLHIESLYKENKVQHSPLRTLLEIIVKHHIEGHKGDQMASQNKGSDSLQSALEISPSPLSMAKTHSKLKESNPEHCTASFISGDPNKLRSHGTEVSSSQKETVSLDEERLRNYSETPSLSFASLGENSQLKMTSLHDNDHFIISQPDINPPANKVIQKSRPNRLRRGMMSAPIASTVQESNKQRQCRKAGMPQSQSWGGMSGNSLLQKVLEKPLSEVTDGAKSIQEKGIFSSKIENSKTLPNVKDSSEMVLYDIDDELPELSKILIESATITARKNETGQPMDQQTASELKSVLLGSSLKCFPVEWRNQGFTFSETHDLRYGMVQKRGGPCGVLATIQAFVLKKLLFENVDCSNTTRLQCLRPSNATRRKCLVLALAEVLWRAGEEKQAIVAINTGRVLFTPSGQYNSEGVLEKLSCYTLDHIKDVQSLLEQHIEQFETGELGCLLLTISAILSRSIDKLKEEMDVETTTLIGAHSYCTQELVNLLLVGQAVSNVFDGNVELDPGTENSTLLKGIKTHCNIGLLSLFEHWNIFKVGDYLKNPLFPIWVVFSESHFSVLFGLQGELVSNQDKNVEFDLYYYDGLANQQEEIRLTVSFGKSGSSCQDLIPPLDHCIRTRWKDAFVSWNDTEPIL